VKSNILLYELKVFGFSLSVTILPSIRFVFCGHLNCDSVFN